MFSLRSQQCLSLPDPTVIQRVSGKRGPSRRLWRAGLPAEPVWQLCSVLPSCTWSFSPSPRQPETWVGIKSSMKKPLPRSKSWGFRKSTECCKDARDDSRAGYGVARTSPGDGEVEGNGDPLLPVSRVQLGLPGAPPHQAATSGLSGEHYL